MQTLLKLIAGIVVLDVVVLGMLGAAGNLAHHRAKRRAASVQPRQGERLRLVPGATRRRLSSGMIGVAVVVLAVGALVARDLHLVTGAHSDQAAGDLGRRRALASRDARSVRSARSVAAAPKTALRPPGSRRSEARLPALPTRGAGVTHPASPSVVTAVPRSATEIDLAWTDVGNRSRYRIQRSSSAVTGWITIATTEKGVTAYSDAGLPPGTTYFYRVVATSADGTSAPSDVASSTTITLPGSPQTLMAVAASSTEISLSWGDVAEETGFRVERSFDGATGWVAIATTGQGVTSYNDAQLSPGVTYYYRVFATDAGGDSLPSDVVSCTTGVDTSSPPGTDT